MLWPFPDDDAFRAWAYDPDAALDEYFLQVPEGLPLLVPAPQRRRTSRFTIATRPR